MKKLHLLALSVVTALAQTPYSDFDTNKDGVISESEFYDRQAKNMQQKSEENRMMKNAANAPKYGDLDLNKDGQVTQEEHQQFQNERMNQNRNQNSYKNTYRGNSPYGQGQGFGGKGNGGGR